MTKIKEAELVQLVAGRYVVSVVKIEDVEAAISIRGGARTGTVTSKYRPEWNGLPRFNTFSGPCAAKDPQRVRYEDAGTYRSLSE